MKRFAGTFERVPQRLHVEAARHGVPEVSEREAVVPGQAAADQKGQRERDEHHQSQGRARHHEVLGPHEPRRGSKRLQWRRRHGRRFYPIRFGYSGGRAILALGPA